MSLLLEHHAATGRGAMLVMGDFNLLEAQLSSLITARRAGWLDLGLEGTCLTANSVAAMRIDMLWASPVMAGRSGAAEVPWDKGLPVQAVQFWKPRGPFGAYFKLGGIRAYC